MPGKSKTAATNTKYFTNIQKPDELNSVRDKILDLHTKRFDIRSRRNALSEEKQQIHLKIVDLSRELLQLEKRLDSLTMEYIKLK